MAANTSPIFSDSPNVSNGIWTSSLTANTKSDGTGTIGTDMVLVFTANATDGSFVNRIRFTPSASVAATATTASVIRVYYSTVGSGATARTNTFLIAEIAVPAQTADQTTTATNFYEIPLGFGMPAGSFLHFSMHHAAAANTSWQATCFGGNY